MFEKLDLDSAELPSELVDLSVVIVRDVIIIFIFQRVAACETLGCQIFFKVVLEEVSGVIPEVWRWVNSEDDPAVLLLCLFLLGIPFRCLLLDLLSDL